MPHTRVKSHAATQIPINQLSFQRAHKQNTQNICQSVYVRLENDQINWSSENMYEYRAVLYMLYGVKSSNNPVCDWFLS